MNKPTTVIQAHNSLKLIDFTLLWEYRELFVIFSWRDLKVRYKQTFLGVAWVVFQPLLTTLIFTYFFGKVAHIYSGNISYSLFVLCGLIFWNYFSSTLSHASSSFVDNESIIKKIFFPRLILPVSSVITGLADFIINLLILFGYAFFQRVTPSPTIFLTLILGIIITALTSTGLGLLLASLNVKYRDVRYILPFFIQLLLFLSPVIYPVSMINPTNRFLMAINPLTGVIESVRASISNVPVNWPFLLISAVSSFILLFIALYIFRSTEKFIADIV